MAKNIGILLLALLFAGFGAFFISRKGNFSPLDSLAGAAGFLTGDQAQKIEKLDSSLKETDSLLRDLKKEIFLLREKAEEDAQERDELKQELETERKTIAALEETLKNQEKAGELGEKEYKKELALFRAKFEELSSQIAGLEEKIDLLSGRILEEKKEASSTEAEIKKDSGLCQKKEGEKPRVDEVIFNEIAWMGKASSSAAEWIELRNISGKEMDLSGWQIQNKDQKIKVIFPKGAKLLKNGFFLLERTDDKTVPGVKADLIYTGAIKNSDEALYLFDKNCQLQDEVLASSTWPAGDNSTKRTMERKSDKSWQTSANPGGTPKEENSNGYTTLLTVSTGGGGGGGEERKEEKTQSPTICSQESLPAPTYYPIIFNEIAWMGSASSSADEWIELKNISTSTISLNNWQLIGIKTQNNEIKIKIFFDAGDSISPNSYFLLERSNDNSVPGISADKIFTKGINDSAFALRLFNSQCQLIDEITATSTWPAGQKKPTRKTMERAGNLNWYTSYTTASINGLFGTPKAENSSLPLNHPPIALFTFSPPHPIVGKEISFDASNSSDTDGTITKYLWNFGDSTTTTFTTEATTTHSFATSGDFLVKLTVLDDKNATATATTTIKISENPILEVVINEIAWMGTATSSSDEWIELYNNSDQDIDLTDWKIMKDREKFITISTTTAKEITDYTTTTILAHQYYLLERTDDKTISNIPADFIYKGDLSLNNKGNELELRNKEENLVDKVGCFKNKEGNCLKWFAGENKNKKENGKWIRVSMERISSTSSGATSTNWADNNLIIHNGRDAGGNPIWGTPKAKNSVSISSTTISSLPFDEFSKITLTKLGSPYVIEKDIAVPASTTLKIDPGVILKLNSGMEIEGKLEAIGESDKKIVFISVKDN